jgi:NAD-dependent deacetylase
VTPGGDAATGTGASPAGAAPTEPAARRLLAAARRVVVLTGAGISTDSGIPDFRGPQGLWTRDPRAERVSSLDAYLSSSEVRRRSWQGMLASPARHARPNAGHGALIELERDGRLELLVTQNTDGLHLDAGHDPAKVLEIHGSSRVTRCLGCGRSEPTEAVLGRVAAGDDDPRCPGCGGILKRTTVLFGEELDPAAVARARAAAERCDVLLCVGSTLAVYPVAGLVPLARRVGAAVVIVNGSPTALDHEADVLVRGPIGVVLPGLLAPG